MMLTVNCLTGKASIISPWSTTVTASRDRRCPPDPQVSVCRRFFDRTSQICISFCKSAFGFPDLHFALQICARFSRFAFRFANLHSVFQICISFCKSALGFPDLHFVLQICIRISRFAFHFANLRSVFQICISFCKSALGFPDLHSALQISASIRRIWIPQSPMPVFMRCLGGKSR